ncbi:hypothetical protein BAE44_0009858 [Dichanthelium oligosanthes]|uniref:Uncharacterized protein n=1 Tax=Dichanthelium oligosanthes TaxID=888268 RepID=A0A1E5VVG1_9POAL|nr:hypothetical protein BAE44_0009858 [Dichanthelium oligosanthes]
MKSSTAYPRWVMLEYNDGESKAECSFADAKTAAACRSSSGRRIRVSFLLKAAPATSRLRIHDPDRPNSSYYHIVAGHGAMLIHDRGAHNYFNYNAHCALKHRNGDERGERELIKISSNKEI